MSIKLSVRVIAGGMGVLCALASSGVAARAQGASVLDRVSSAPIPDPAGAQSFGGVTFKVPAGWRRVNSNVAVFLEPTDLPAGQVCRIMIPLGGELKGDFRAQFEEEVKAMRNGIKGAVTDPGQIREKKPAAGCDALSNVCNITREDGSQWTIFLMAFHPGSRFESIAYMVNPPDLYEKYGDTVNRFLAELRFGAAETVNPAAAATVLVQGETPLTQEMVDRYNLLFEWLLDVQTTQEQRQLIHDFLVQAWQAKSKADIDSALNVINAQKQIETRPAQEKELLRQTLQAKFLDALRKQPDSEASKWVFSIYDTAHKPVAPGSPPLTRQASDAWLEALCFMRTEVAGGQPIYANTAMKDAFVKGIASAYGQWTDVQRKHVASMPLYWASLRVEWPRLDEAQKAKYRTEWKGYLQQMAPEILAWKPAQPTAQQAAQIQGQIQSRQQIAQSGDNLTEAEKRARAQRWYQQEMARLQSSHSTYMMMSNMATMNHVTNMNMIGNIGNSGWKYEYKYR